MSNSSDNENLEQKFWNRSGLGILRTPSLVSIEKWWTTFESSNISGCDFGPPIQTPPSPLAIRLPARGIRAERPNVGGDRSSATLKVRQSNFSLQVGVRPATIRGAPPSVFPRWMVQADIAIKKGQKKAHVSIQEDFKRDVSSQSVWIPTGVTAHDSERRGSKGPKQGGGVNKRVHGGRSVQECAVARGIRGT